jgi:hypothetical protein
LLCLGIIGEYLGRIFTQTKNRPNYLIQEAKLHHEYRIDNKTTSEKGKPLDQSQKKIES